MKKKQENTKMSVIPIHCRLTEVQDQIKDGDLLLFRRRGVISVAGRGDHSHAAMAAHWENDLFCLEVRELLGGRAVTMDSQVRQYPGRIDVYEANPENRWPEFDRCQTVRQMRRFAGCSYGWVNLLCASLVHLPWIRLLIKPTQTTTLSTAGRPSARKRRQSPTALGVELTR